MIEKWGLSPFLAEALIQQLDPPRRAAVLMAILGLVLLGMVLVACVMIGGRWVRRMARDKHGATTLTANVENQRVRAALKAVLPEGEAGETIAVDYRGDQTKIDR